MKHPHIGFNRASDPSFLGEQPLFFQLRVAHRRIRVQGIKRVQAQRRTQEHRPVMLVNGFAVLLATRAPISGLYGLFENCKSPDSPICG